MASDARHSDGERRWRLGRSLMDGLDKGAGAERRVREANRRRGIYRAKILPAERWIPGKLSIEGTSLVFSGDFGEFYRDRVGGASLIPKVDMALGSRLLLALTRHRRLRVTTTKNGEIVVEVSKNDFEPVLKRLTRQAADGETVA